MKKFLPSYHPASRGSALLSTIVAFGILGIVVMVSTQSFTNNTRVIKDIKVKGELEDLRNYLRASVSCERTFTTQACDGPIALKPRVGKNIVKKNPPYKKIGNYELKSSCTNAEGVRKITVSYKSGDEDWGSLFSGIPLTCGSSE